MFDSRKFEKLPSVETFGSYLHHGVEVTEHFVDQFMRFAFSFGATVGILDCFNHGLLALQIVQQVNGGWNIVDALGGIVAGINKYVEGIQRSTVWGKAKKLTLGTGDLVTGTNLAFWQVVMYLQWIGIGAAGVGALALAVPIAAFSFSACMAIAALNEAIEALSALRKMYDTDFFLRNRLQKIESIDKKIAKLNKKKEKAKNDNKAFSYAYEIEKLDEKRNILVTQAVATYKASGKSKLDNRLNKVIKDEDFTKLDDAFAKLLVAELKKHQFDKFVRHSIRFVPWFLAAVGTLLIALSLANPMFAPLLIPGIVIVSVSAAIKFTELSYLLVNFIMRKVAQWQDGREQKALLTSGDENSPLLDEFSGENNIKDLEIDDEKKVKLLAICEYHTKYTKSHNEKVFKAKKDNEREASLMPKAGLEDELNGENKQYEDPFYESEEASKLDSSVDTISFGEDLLDDTKQLESHYQAIKLKHRNDHIAKKHLRAWIEGRGDESTDVADNTNRLFNALSRKHRKQLTARAVERNTLKAATKPIRWAVKQCVAAKP